MNAAALFANAKNSVLSHAVPAYRPGQRAIARSTAVFAVSVVTAGLALASASPASAGPLHAMTIDATALSTDAINIAGVTTTALSTTSVITVDLPEGVTTFNAGGGSFYCQPSVTATGTWSLPAPCDGAASGAGTSALKLTGLPITLDASDLSTGVDPLLYGNLVVAAGSTQSFTWMPQPPVEMVVGSALASRCGFGLATNANATVYHCGTSATVSGHTVNFVGFPFAFDARSLSTNGYLIDAISLEAQTSSSASVHDYRLMAANGYTMQIGAAIVATFHWGIGAAGLVSYPSADSTFLAGKGTTTLVVNGLPARVNATGLGAGTFTLGPDIFGPAFDQTSIQYLRLVPSTYEFESASLASPEYFAWDLQNNGTAGFVTGDPHPCAQVAGPALVVDCSAPTFTEVSGTPNPVGPDRTFTVTGRECDRVADVRATGTITFTDLSTGLVLGTVALVPSSAYVNCGEATVVDSEHLAPGSYEVKASYTASGGLPVPASVPATYRQLVLAT